MKKMVHFYFYFPFAAEALPPSVGLFVAFVEGYGWGTDGVDGCLRDGDRAIGGFSVYHCVGAVYRLWGK